MRSTDATPREDFVSWPATIKRNHERVALASKLPLSTAVLRCRDASIEDLRIYHRLRSKQRGHQDRSIAIEQIDAGSCQLMISRWPWAFCVYREPS